MEKLEAIIREKLEEPMKRVALFEFENRIEFVNQNVMGVVRFSRGPDRFTLGWLAGIDTMIC